MQKIGPWFDEARTSQDRWSALPPFSLQTFDTALNAQAIGVRSFDPEIQSEARSTLDQLLELDRTVGALAPAFGVRGGAANGMAALKRFIADGLNEYGEKKADKSLGAQSTLSAWLHFGMLSPAQILDDIFDYLGDSENSSTKQNSLFSGLELKRPTVAAFVEQLVVRRELAANLCRFNHLYDKWEGLPNWSRASLLKHASDTRLWRYSALELETAETHDSYWNAAQQQLRKSGFIHNHMRMYWGKKILEWSKTPEEAFYTAIRLNDRWALDGRDANGYAGVAWCFGTHDRPWTERPIFGMVRYMNDKGLERKFKMAPYLEKWLS
ncbi:MAG: hypothetical protein IAF58_12305 [Leptolyngbya sp.]|nr:hypothetical protein [Candidatus Melainabacteria bacterium]